jgi:protein-S-isoprenylcysteine O-methyltransferase Ste14
MEIQLLRWFSLALSLSLPLVYFRGGTDAVRDIRRSVSATGGHSCAVVTLTIAAGGLAILAAQLLICLGVVEPAAWGESLWAALPGAVLVAIGTLGAYWIRYRYLGRFWSGTVEIHDGHTVVEAGPYGAVRHPIYSLTLALYPGAALVFPLWWNWLACAIVLASYVWLAAYEDAFLADNLPGYREYQKRTRFKMLPGIW